MVKIRGLFYHFLWAGYKLSNLNKDTSSYTTNDLNSSEIIIKSLELEKEFYPLR